MTASASNVPEISVYDRMCWSEAQLEQALLGGGHRRELSAYFGSAEYVALESLARRAARTPQRHATHVYILPGIMGSQLGWRREPLPPDLLWLDPVDIERGRLAELDWRAGAALTTLGAITYSYLPLKLRLRAAGFAVSVYDYDWRRDLLEMAAPLALRWQEDPYENIALIGHSMGGLLARAALRLPGAERVRRLVTLGTPHGGSIAAVQALRATYPVVCRLAALDKLHSAEFLTDAVFKHFPSLYQLLPQAAAGIDVFDIAQWPRTGPRPDPALLQAARAFRTHIAAADARFVSIIGTGQRTVMGLGLKRGQFSYEVGSGGDGTVPAAAAHIDGARAYYLRCEHSELPRHPQIAAAIVDVLLRGRTGKLATRKSTSSGRQVQVTDAQLRRSFGRKIDWHTLSAEERRLYLNRLNRPPPQYYPQPKALSSR